MSNRTLIIGCGYLGLRVARLLKQQGERVFATSRSPDRLTRFADEGIEPILADVLDPASLTALPSVDRVFYAVASDRSSGIPVRRLYVDGLQNALHALASKTSWIVSAGSTGVYGDHDGDWVDETTPTDPQSESGRACLAAEHLLQEFSQENGLRATVLRFSGLYGPNRQMRREAILKGEPIASNPDSYLNLVQIDDAAAASVVALRSDNAGPLYLISDDRPIPRRTFYETLAKHLDAPAPTFTDQVGNSGQTFRGESSKRISNRLAKSELGIQLSYPDISTGIPASLAIERNSSPRIV